MVGTAQKNQKLYAHPCGVSLTNIDWYADVLAIRSCALAHLIGLKSNHSHALARELQITSLRIGSRLADLTYPLDEIRGELDLRERRPVHFAVGRVDRARVYLSEKKMV